MSRFLITKSIRVTTEYLVEADEGTSKDEVYAMLANGEATIHSVSEKDNPCSSFSRLRDRDCPECGAFLSKCYTSDYCDICAKDV
jgi:hypothetical protein